MARDEIRTEVKRGAELQSVIPAVARLRIEVFRDWPYLYEDDPAYEERHLSTYAESPRPWWWPAPMRRLSAHPPTSRP
jgi:hypothetical protein